MSTVLGLVGRDLLFDLIEAVVDEDGPRAFALADRAVESGHDLRLVCRELSRVVRDMMVRLGRSGARRRRRARRGRARAAGASWRGAFSREDLMRAFDLLAKAEQDIRNASQPRYHFEMVLLRWMHLRKLVPLTELLEQLGERSAPAASSRGSAAVSPPRSWSAPPATRRGAARGRGISGTRSLDQLTAALHPRRLAAPRFVRAGPFGRGRSHPLSALKDALPRGNPRAARRSSTTPSWRRRRRSRSATIG